MESFENNIKAGEEVGGNRKNFIEREREKIQIFYNWFTQFQSVCYRSVVLFISSLLVQVCQTDT